MMQTGGSTLVLPEEATDVELSPRWQVLLHNDDTTPMEFVLLVLEKIFKKRDDEAYDIMMEAHETGRSVAAVDSQEKCELRVEQVKSYNAQYQQKLKVSQEKVT